MSKSADLYAVTRQSVYGHRRGSEVCATEFIMVMASDYDALQQRLTVAEKRAGDAIELLEVWRTWLGFNRASCDDGGKRIWDRIDAVVTLKPAAEGGGS